MLMENMHRNYTYGGQCKNRPLFFFSSFYQAARSQKLLLIEINYLIALTFFPLPIIVIYRPKRG